LGFLLLVSLAASTAISAVGAVINAHLPFGTIILASINGIVSFVLISALFAAIFKILPEPVARVARCRNWRGSDRFALHHRQVADRLVHRNQRDSILLWRGGCTPGRAALGLLFVGDIPARR
jgi:hypothetical protein